MLLQQQSPQSVFIVANHKPHFCLQQQVWLILPGVDIHKHATSICYNDDFIVMYRWWFLDTYIISRPKSTSDDTDHMPHVFLCRPMVGLCNIHACIACKLNTIEQIGLLQQTCIKMAHNIMWVIQKHFSFWTLLIILWLSNTLPNTCQGWSLPYIQVLVSLFEVTVLSAVFKKNSGLNLT